MTIRLGDNRYGKAETRLVRLTRDGDRHELVDLNVSVALAGDLEATHLTGDNSAVLPTDTQKNTVYALSRQLGPVEALPADLPMAEPRVVRVDRRSDVELWSRPWLLLAALMLLGLEWALRGRIGYL